MFELKFLDVWNPIWILFPDPSAFIGTQQEISWSRTFGQKVFDGAFFLTCALSSIEKSNGLSLTEERSFLYVPYTNLLLVHRSLPIIYVCNPWVLNSIYPTTHYRKRQIKDLNATLKKTKGGQLSISSLKLKCEIDRGKKIHLRQFLPCRALGGTWEMWTSSGRASTVRPWAFCPL